MHHLNRKHFILADLVIVIVMFFWMWAEVASGAFAHGSRLARGALWVLIALVMIRLLNEALLLGVRYVQQGVHDEKYERAMLLPAAIDHMGIDGEGNAILMITRNNGEMTQVTLPEEYEAMQDNGKLLLEAACPGMRVDDLPFMVIDISADDDEDDNNE